MRSFLDGAHPWRAGQAVELGERFDGSKVDNLLEHMESDCVNSGEQVRSAQNGHTAAILARSSVD
jgi:hypothetical protein